MAYDYTLARWYAGQGDRLENDSARLEEVARLLPYVKTPYVTGKIVQSYASGCETRRTQERQKPRTKADEYFDELIAPYKENVLFLDFWSTGCGPCRSGMIAAKPVVERFENQVPLYYRRIAVAGRGLRPFFDGERDRGRAYPGYPRSVEPAESEIRHRRNPALRRSR